jgi:hypothetical protein
MLITYEIPYLKQVRTGLLKIWAIIILIFSIIYEIGPDSIALHPAIENNKQCLAKSMPFLIQAGLKKVKAWLMDFAF